MLKEAGVDPSRPRPLETWTVFKAFAALPVEGTGPDPDDDLLLFQWGTFDWGDRRGEHFEVDFLRQFSVYSRGNAYDHMEQLHCTFSFEPSDGLRSLGSGDRWRYGSLEQWVDEVEAFPVFHAAVVQPKEPLVDAFVRQEHV